MGIARKINFILNSPDSSARRKARYCATKSAKVDKSNKRESRVVAPEGCFSVYVVGSEKQRFVNKAECANHPQFQMLLEDAELEWVYRREGPILIPCDANLFYEVLAEMERGEIDSDCSMAHGTCGPFSPLRFGSIIAKSYLSFDTKNIKDTCQDTIP